MKLSPRRKLSFAATAFCLSTVTCLVPAEIVLRVVAPVPFFEGPLWEPEGHIRARLVPNQQINTVYGSTVRINKHGFRGRDHEFEKPDKLLRIAVFGGSSAFCGDLNEDKTWPALLEQRLNEGLGVPVEVVNLGLPGYDVFNSKINYLCFGRAFHPDAIIVYHTWNDMKAFRGLEDAPYRPADLGVQRAWWQRMGRSLARHSQLGRRLRDAVSFVLEKRAERITESTYHAEETESRSHDRAVSERAFAWEQQNFRDFVDFARSDGVLPILVSQATLVCEQNITTADPSVAQALRGAPLMVGMTHPILLRTWAHVSAIIEKVAKEKEVIFVDGYRAVPHDLRYALDHVHLKEPGAVALADTIARCLLNDTRFLRLAARFRQPSEKLGETRADEGHPALPDKTIE